jgi:ribonuclease HI
VYFISEVIHEAKTRYLEVHKLLYAVLITSRKLRHYFQAHMISVVTWYPPMVILRNPNTTDNIVKWAAELAEFELDFIPHHAVKSQVLTDFIIDWTPSASPPGGSDDNEPEPRASVFTGPHWTLFFDGSSRKQGVGVGVVLLAPHGDQIKCMVHLDFKATNNMAEYEALLSGLSTTLSLGVRQLLVKGDSKLIVKQVKGDCSCNDPQLAAYLLHAHKLEKDFEVLDLQHIPRAENIVADDLSAKASTSVPVSGGVLERRLRQPTAWAANPSEGGETSTSKLAVLLPWSLPSVLGITGDSVHPDAQDPEAQASPDTWITEIQTYLKDNNLLDDMAFTDWIAHLAKRYTLVEGDPYRSGTNGVLMRCITREEGCELLTEVHRDECENHASFCMLVGKSFWHGFYWPTALDDAVELVKSCKACQFHAKQIHMSTQTLQMIPPSWSFAVWGLDIVEPFPHAVGWYWFLYVAIDKFTKWPEATPVVKINKQSAVKFIKSIIYRFRVPNQIITDNGSQFTSGAFQGYCEDPGIQIYYASPAHPESNG